MPNRPALPNVGVREVLDMANEHAKPHFVNSSEAPRRGPCSWECRWTRAGWMPAMGTGLFQRQFGQLTYDSDGNVVDWGPPNTDHELVQAVDPWGDPCLLSASCWKILQVIVNSSCHLKADVLPSGAAPWLAKHRTM